VEDKNKTLCQSDRIMLLTYRKVQTISSVRAAF